MNQENSKKLKEKIRQISWSNRKPRGILKINNRSKNIIDLKNVEKYYISGNLITHVLKDVTLSIKKGDFVIIFGQSGSGKSTLLNIMSGLDRATAGDIIVGNVNLAALKDSQMTTFRRDNVGFIFQSYNLLSDLNARDNAKMGQVLQSDKSKALNVDELFDDMGIKSHLNDDIRNLSGGQQQRVSIARALAKNPQIIFADEPTGSLDRESSNKVIELLKYINQKYLTTIVVVTHDENWKRVADQILEVDEGRIFAREAIT